MAADTSAMSAAIVDRGAIDRPAISVGVQSWPTLAVVTLLSAPLLIASVGAFPLFDDGWLWLLAKESGPSSVAATVPDRPLYGALLQIAAGVPQPWIWCVVNSVTWAVL